MDERAQHDPERSGQKVSQGVLELRAEQAVVNKQRVPAGSVSVRRERRTRQQILTIDLIQEVLVLEAQPGGSGVVVDGEPLEPGETREITIYQEEAQIGKRVVVAEQVEVFKRSRVDHQTVPIELAYEELDVNHSAGLTVQEEAFRKE